MLKPESHRLSVIQLSERLKPETLQNLNPDILNRKQASNRTTAPSLRSCKDQNEMPELPNPGLSPQGSGS